MDDISSIYSQPSNVFIGAGRRQRGGGFFGKIARFAIPILKRIGSALGKEAINFAGNTISDLSEGRDLKSTLQKRGVESLANASNKIFRKPKRRNIIN